MGLGSGTALEINGYSLDAPEAEAVIVVEQLAAGDLAESELAKWLRDSSVPAA